MYDRFNIYKICTSYILQGRLKMKQAHFPKNVGTITWGGFVQAWVRLCHSLLSQHDIILPVVLLTRRSRDSSIGIEAGYGLDALGVGVQVPVGSRIFFSPRHPDQPWGGSSPGAKVAEA
jgi:hypothetical protein